MMSTPASTRPDGTKERSRLIKLLHVGRRNLKMDDDTWRAYLNQAFGVSSSTQLSIDRLRAALTHLERCGFQIASNSAPHEWTWVDTAPADRAPLLRKIIMLMKATDVTRGNQVAYVEGIARQMSGFNGSGKGAIHTPLSMCGPEQLLDIVKALAIHIKRERDRAAADA